MALILTPNEKVAAELEARAQQANTTPEEIALQIIEEHFRKYPAEPATSRAKPYVDEERVAKAEAKIAAGQMLDWEDIIGIFSSGLTDTAERFEEILEEEWRPDENWGVG